MGTFFGSSGRGGGGDPALDLENYKIELDRRLRHALSHIDVTTGITGLSANRLVSSNASGGLASVSNLTNWIAGTSNQIVVTSDGDGTVSISAPQNLHTGATPDFAGGRFGNIAGGNYLQIESDGTPVFNGNATGWEDIDFPIIIRTTGTGIPTLQVVQDGLTAPQWQVNDSNMCEGKELIHGWKEGSEVRWHIHMITNGLDVNNRYVKWEVKWMWVNVDGQMQATQTQSYEFEIPANTPDKTMFIIPIYQWTPTGGKIAAHVFPRLTRIASSGTAPTNNPWCNMLQMHVECDTIRSRDYQTK